MKRACAEGRADFKDMFDAIEDMKAGFLRYKTIERNVAKGEALSKTRQMQLIMAKDRENNPLKKAKIECRRFVRRQNNTEENRKKRTVDEQAA